MKYLEASQALIRSASHTLSPLSLSVSIANSNPIGPISNANPSSVAWVSSGGAVAASSLCAWWWGFKRRRKALSLMRFFSLGFLILGFALALPFDDWGLRRTCIRIGFFFFFFFKYVWVRPLGICLRLMLSFFFGLAL